MNHFGTKRLETDRLFLRKFVLEDAAHYYANCTSDEKMTRYFGYGPDETVAKTLVKIAIYLEQYERDTAYIWAIEEKQSGEVIGSITVDVPYPALEIGEAGYNIGSRWWGRGYATEALSAVLRYLLEEEGLYLIEAKHNVNNAASGKVMQKAGMKKEAVLRGRRRDKTTGKREDLVVYSITKPELKAPSK